MGRFPQSGHETGIVLEKVVEYAFYVLILAMCLMLGTTLTRPLPLIISNVGIVAIFCLFISARKNREKKIVIPKFSFVFVLLAMFSLIQIIPLPQFLIKLLSPTTNELYQSTLESISMYGNGQWMPLSIEPVATLNAAGRWMILWAVFVLATNLFAHGESRRRFSLSLGVTGLLLVFLGLLHKLSGTDKIFFSIPFVNDPPFFFSSFINPNNLAGFLCMCAPIWLGFTVHTKKLEKKLIGTLAFVMTSTAIILTLSLGGILAWVFGLMLFIVLYSKRKKSSDGKKSVIWLQLAGIFALLAGAYVSAGPILHKISGRMATPNQNRLMIWQDCLDMIKDHPLVGVGGYAYEMAFHRYQNYILHGRVVYPENIVIQNLSEYGIIVTALVIVAVLMVIFRLIISRLRTSEIAYLSAVISVLVSNQFDFNLNQLSVAVPFTAMFAVLVKRRTEAYEADPSFKNFLFLPSRIPEKVFSLLVVLLFLNGILGTCYWKYNRVEEDRETVYAVINNSNLKEAEFKETVYPILKQHPSDRYLRILASEHYPVGSRSGLPYKLLHLQKASFLAPVDSLVYRLIGRAYAGVGMNEEAIENYDKALKNTWRFDSAQDVFLEMSKNGFSIDEIVSATPHYRMKEFAKLLWLNKKYEALEKVLEKWPNITTSDTADAYEWKIRLKLKAADYKTATILANSFLKEFPSDYRGYLLKADSLRLQAEYLEAADYYKMALEKGALETNTNLALAQVYYDVSNLKEAKKATDKAWVNTSNNKYQTRDILLMYARISLKEGEYVHARQDCINAIKLDKNHWQSHQMLAMVYEAQRKWQLASKYYKKAIKLARNKHDIESVKALKTRLHRVESFIHDIPRYNPRKDNKDN